MLRTTQLETEQRRLMAQDPILQKLQARGLQMLRERLVFPVSGKPWRKSRRGAGRAAAASVTVKSGRSVRITARRK
jgi:hypothetical protein